MICMVENRLKFERFAKSRVVKSRVAKSQVLENLATYKSQMVSALWHYYSLSFWYAHLRVAISDNFFGIFKVDDFFYI